MSNFVKVVCDWCGMDVWRDADLISEEENIFRHKISNDPTLRCLHQDKLEISILGKTIKDRKY